MLIKLLCDGSCDFVKRLGASEMNVGWIVEEDVPLHDPAQVKSLNTAIHSSSDSTAPDMPPVVVESLSSYILTALPSGEAIDARRTPRDLGLSSGVALRLASAPIVSTPIVSTPIVSAPAQDTNTEDDTDEDTDEHYGSRGLGWFPFLLRHCEGEPMVLASNPFVPAEASDPEPRTETLCETCAAVISKGDALRVAVDRHGRPMLVRQNFLEVCMEKLGGGQLRRWQTRYVQMSEKSVDWFAEKPKPGVKSRIHGHRYLVRDGVCEVVAIIPNPDPRTYPKCKDDKFYHFGIRFCNPDKTYLFRVTTPEIREMVLGFLGTCVKLVQNQKPAQNPVLWKQRADTFLVNAAQLGDTYSQSRMDLEALREEMTSIEKELDAVLEKKPSLLKKLRLQASYVTALRAELAGYEATEKKGQQRLRAAEAQVAAERQLLREKEIEMSDEMRKAAALKSHALQQRTDAEKRIAELRARALELQREEEVLFKKWRAFEERHRTRAPVPQGIRMFSFSRDGVGSAGGMPRASTALAVSVAKLTAEREQSLLMASVSPQRKLFHSTSLERSI